MNKKIIMGCLALAIAALAAWNLNFGSKTDSRMSDVILANVQALADAEGLPGSDGACYKNESTECTVYYIGPGGRYYSTWIDAWYLD